MRSHDVDFIQTKAENDMNGHVEGPERQGEPHQTGMPSKPYSTQKQQHNQRLNDVIEGISVMNNERTGA